MPSDVQTRLQEVREQCADTLLTLVFMSDAGDRMAHVRPILRGELLKLRETINGALDVL